LQNLQEEKPQSKEKSSPNWIKNKERRKMAIKKPEFPEVGDLVIATIKSITSYGAYVVLDEYDKEGLLHISEISSGWVRNIRSFVREGQKVVLKVLRVNAEKGHVDLSLRRVTKHDKREKILVWKRERKAESLLRSVSKKSKIPVKEIYEKAGSIIEEAFGGLYEGLEKTAREGVDVLLEIGVPKEIATIIAEVAKEKIKISMVKIKGTLELQCTKPNGVVLIQKSLLNAQKIEKSRGTIVRVYVISPPKYRIEVSAEDYKEAERLLEKASKTALNYITKVGGEGVFKREK
jgi:translation initiation factor 2 subunit 1